MTARFPLRNLLGLEERNHGPDTALVVCKIDPASIIFPPNKCVSEWKPIVDLFPDLHVENGASVDWQTKHMLVRYRLKVNTAESTKPVLLLEGMILPTGTWEGVADTKRETLSSDASSALRLWGSEDCKWYSPMPLHKLPTAPGISKLSLDTPLPSELEYRWFLHILLNRCARGKSVESKQEFESYLNKPYPTAAASVPVCPIPNHFSIRDLTTDTPTTTGMFRTNCIKFERHGKIITRERSVSYPLPHKLPKFNTVKKGVDLSNSALPDDTPEYLRRVASNMFNASIAQASGKSYATAANHVASLEKELGRKLSWPLTPEDSNMILAYLLSKGFKPSTVRSYLAGVRRLALSKGVHNPAPQSELAKTFLRGYENSSRNPVIAVAGATHRPVSIPFLRLLGHASNKYWTGNLHDKQCFWVICVTAFWGSLRIGELLCKECQSFSPISDLLGTDVIFISTSSIAFWIRDPKVPKPFGDVVEIWGTPTFYDIDPFMAFSVYWSQRKTRPLNHPLFLKADGNIFTHSLFSHTLKALISHYSLELELSINRWTGHSFRSGLPTLLQSAGFKDDEIQSWGRWVSTAFQLYTKDVVKRFEVQRTMVKHMDRIKAYVEGVKEGPSY